MYLAPVLCFHRGGGLMRVFKCPSCGHRMRLSGDRCGRCFAEKPIFKTVGPYKFLLYLVLLSLAITAFIRALSYLT